MQQNLDKLDHKNSTIIQNNHGNEKFLGYPDEMKIPDQPEAETSEKFTKVGNNLEN